MNDMKFEDLPAEPKFNHSKGRYETGLWVEYQGPREGFKVSMNVYWQGLDRMVSKNLSGLRLAEIREAYENPRGWVPNFIKVSDVRGESLVYRVYAEKKTIQDQEMIDKVNRQIDKMIFKLDNTRTVRLDPFTITVYPGESALVATVLAEERQNSETDFVIWQQGDYTSVKDALEGAKEALRAFLQEGMDKLSQTDMEAFL